MNELQLSNNLDQIELEIQHHKTIAGQSVWEIGRRLNHVKENDLVHGEFGNWLKKIDIEHQTANRLMKVAKEIPYSTPVSNLGYSVLHLIATLPKDMKEAELQKVEDGNPSSKREIEEIKRKNKQLEQQVVSARKSEEIALQKLEEAENKEPKVITQTVERVVVPDDYKDLERKSKKLEDKVFQLNKRLERIREIDNYEEKAKSIKQEVEYLNGERQKLKHIFDSAEKLQQLERKFNDFFDSEMAPLKYKPLINDLTNTNGVSRMKEMVNLARAWVEDMDRMLPAENRQIIEAEMVE